MQLTSEQISFFRQYGYLIIPGLMDLALCRQARDMLWHSLPDDADIKRSEVNSHVGPFSEHDFLDDPLNSRVGFRWQLRETSTHKDLIDLVYSSSVMAIAEQLLGRNKVQQPVVDGSVMGSRGKAWPDGPVDPALNSEGIRGIYATLPNPAENAAAPTGAHTDGHPFMLSLVGLIDDVPPGGGAFTVWPGSHARLYPVCQMQYDQPRIPFYDHLPSFKGIIHPQAYHDELAQILLDTKPVDCWGSAGDVVFWHHRLVHAASENTSDVIRQAVLADLNRSDLDTLRLDPPQQNMWRDWSEEVQTTDAPCSPAFLKMQRIT